MVFPINEFALLFVTFIAVSAESILSDGKAIGTSNNQVLLGALVVLLIFVVIYRERQQNIANKLADARHVELAARLNMDRTLFDEERRQRISMLVGMIKDNTAALERNANAGLLIKDAVEANTEATRSLINNVQRIHA